jgi:hypothetical protein
VGQFRRQVGQKWANFPANCRFSRGFSGLFESRAVSFPNPRFDPALLTIKAAPATLNCRLQAAINSRWNAHHETNRGENHRRHRGAPRLGISPKEHRPATPHHAEAPLCAACPEDLLRSRDEPLFGKGCRRKHSRPVCVWGEFLGLQGRSQRRLSRISDLRDTLHWGTGGGDPCAADSGCLIRQEADRKQSGTRFPKEAVVLRGGPPEHRARAPCGHHRLRGLGAAGIKVGNVG